MKSGCGDGMNSVSLAKARDMKSSEVLRTSGLIVALALRAQGPGCCVAVRAGMVRQDRVGPRQLVRAGLRQQVRVGLGRWLVVGMFVPGPERAGMDVSGC